jgi:hypothetical protein
MPLGYVLIEARPHRYPRAREFNRWISHLRHLHNRLLKPLKTGKVDKILLLFAPDAHDPYEPDTTSDIVGNTLSFDFEAFWKASPDKRRRLVADAIRNGLLEIARAHQWNTDQFVEWLDRVEATGLKNEETGLVVMSRNKKMAAHWHYAFEPERIVYSVRIEDNKGKLLKDQVVFQSEPNQMAIADVLGALTWPSSKTVVLRSKNRKQHWTVDVP